MNNKKEQFKQFAASHPELIKHIQNGNMSWQKFYEIYDIYGEDNNAWKDYLEDSAETSNSMNLDSITKMVKNIDVNSIQKHINTAQKALGLISELTTKNVSAASNIKTPLNPRPLNKFFED